MQVQCGNHFADPLSQEGYVPPRKPYAFEEMLADVLNFAFLMLVDGGRLSMWLPTANDEDVELLIPVHPGLELVSVCVQQFNKCKPPHVSCDRIQRLTKIRGTTTADIPKAARLCHD